MKKLTLLFLFCATTVGLIAQPTPSTSREATAAEVTAGTRGDVFISPRRLSGSSGSTSITTLGTVTTGTWNAGVILGQYGGTGVANTGKTITIGGNVIYSGAFASTFTLTGITTVTFPTTGTLATLAGAESITNKKLGSLTTNGLVTTSGGDGTLSVTVPGSGFLTFVATPSSANLRGTITDEVGTGAAVFELGSPVFNDIILAPSGTSGPSVKSSLAARMARQGLVFNGTAGATVSVTPGSRWTLAFWARPTAIGANMGVINVNNPYDGICYFNTTGNPRIYDGTDYITSTAAAVAGKEALWVFVADGTNGTWYKDGIAAGTAVSAGTYAQAIVNIGYDVIRTAYFNGTLRVLIYNRALTAAEVLTLTETGAPAGADYNSASNTSLFTGANSDFSGAGSWGLGGGATISGGKLNIPAGGNADNSIAALVVGRNYRFTITVDSLTAGSVRYFNGLSVVQFATGAGTYTIDFTAAGTGNLNLYAVGGDAVFDTALFYKTGLLLAPDAMEPGVGYQWHGVSQTGITKDDITLPASGVTFALPSAQGNKVRATLTWAGTHEAKSLLGQVALPSNAVVTSITSTASAGDPGGGMTVGSVTTPNLFVTAVAYTTAKKVHALATQLPAGTAANDLNLVVDPGTSNYTGTIQISVNYVTAQ